MKVIKTKIQLWLLVACFFGSFILAFNEFGVSPWSALIPAFIGLWVLIDFAVENR